MSSNAVTNERMVALLRLSERLSEETKMSIISLLRHDCQGSVEKFALFEAFVGPLKSCADALDIPDIGVRLRLLRRVELVMQEAAPTNYLLVLWAALYLMPIDRLATMCKNRVALQGISLQTQHWVGMNLIIWLERGRRLGDSPFTSYPKDSEEYIAIAKATLPWHPPDDAHAEVLCRERDGNRCIITGLTGPDIVSICPNVLLDSSNDDPGLWRILEAFWGQEKAAVWRRKSVEAGCSNLICLDSSLYTAWSSAKFALQPISIEGTTLKSRFFRLRSLNARNPWVESLLIKPDDILTDATGDAQYARLPPNGSLFAVTAKEPCLLPSFELLELQWHLQRLAVLSGTTEDNPISP